MKKTLPYLLLCLFFGVSAVSHAQKSTDSTLCVYFKNGHMDAFLGEMLKSHNIKDNQLNVRLSNDSLITYAMEEIDSLGGMPKDLPQFSTFKFNNKYNDGLYVDVFGNIKDHEVSATVAAIGKRLTPSFSLSDPDASAYIGAALQQSHKNRLRFDAPITYTLAKPGYRKMTKVKVKDEIWSVEVPGEIKMEEVVLTEDMLSTNAPTNYSAYLSNVLDKDIKTIFHSTWGSGAHEKLPLHEHPYIDVALQEPLQSFLFKYTTSESYNRYPLEILVRASHDGKQWVDVATVNEKDGMPTQGQWVDFKSPLFEMDQPYEYIRFELVRASYKNYFVISELSIEKLISKEDNVPPHIISPAEYAYRWLPFGRDVEVRVDWLTDKAVNVPRIDIDIDGGLSVKDKETYLDADFKLDGASVFPDMESRVRIRGRGNSSWAGEHGKSPYRLKFPLAVKPFGMTKGRNWVLLANRQHNSMLSNAVGMKVARMIKTAWSNDIVPVELYVNGEYRGSYNFTQHVGMHNNSVDVDSTNAVMIELDRYFDEDHKFRTDFFNLPTNIKAPDLKTWPFSDANRYFSRIKYDFNKLCEDVSYGHDIEHKVDMTMLARFIMVNELINNRELQHPKSTYLYREDLQALHSKYIFGPVWDLDWAYGYGGSYDYCVTDPTQSYFGTMRGSGAHFFSSLRFNYPEMARAYYKVWKDFMEQHLDELMEFVDDYYKYANPSFEHNAMRWNGEGEGYEQVAARTKKWLALRAADIFAGLEKFDLDEVLPIAKGDVNQDGAITMADVVSVQQYILGEPIEHFDKHQADMNDDKKISVVDIVWIVAKVLEENANTVRHMQLPMAEASVCINHFVAPLGDETAFLVALTIGEGDYTAAQFDLCLPEGMTLADVTLPEAWSDCTLEFAPLADNNYRVVLYGTNTLPAGEATLQLYMKPEQMIPEEQRVVSLCGATLVSKLGEEERLSSKSVSFDMDATGVTSALQTTSVSGGKVLTVESLTDGDVRIYSVDGRLFRVCSVNVGTNIINLPAGVYIVNQQKVVVND